MANLKKMTKLPVGRWSLECAGMIQIYFKLHKTKKIVTYFDLPMFQMSAISP